MQRWTILVIFKIFSLNLKALDSQQILNQTGIVTITLVEKDPSAIISKNGSPIKKPVAERIIPKNDPLKSSIEARLPAGTVTEQVVEEEYVTEYICFCIPRRRKIIRNVNTISLTDNSLRDKLLNK